MAYYNFKRVRDALPREMVEEWLREDGSADYDSTLWALAAEYIEQLKNERDQAKAILETVCFHLRRNDHLTPPTGATCTNQMIARIRSFLANNPDDPR